MKQFTLNNGIQVVVYEMPYLRSVSMGVWVKAGSILESEQENGLSHFIEHMAFKGTTKRTARQIAQEMDAIGGHMNASTSKLCTNYYVKVIDEDLPLAADILADIVIHPTLDESEFEKERGVILEEIAMVQDTPDDIVYDVLSRAMFAKQSLGQTILGEASSIEGYSVSQLSAYRNKYYSPTNTVISLAGNITQEYAKALVEEKFGDWQGSGNTLFPSQVINAPGKTLYLPKDTEQMHVCVGYVGDTMGTNAIFATAVLNTIFGAGMSSRLFQRIREEQGLAYSVYSSPTNYPTCGDYTIYFGTMPKNTSVVLEQIDVEIQTLLQKGITAQEFLQAKAQLRSDYVLSLESAYNRMHANGHNQLLLGRVVSPEITLQNIEKVTMEDVVERAQGIFTSKRSLAFVGKEEYFHG